MIIKPFWEQSQHQRLGRAAILFIKYAKCSNLASNNANFDIAMRAIENNESMSYISE